MLHFQRDGDPRQQEQHGDAHREERLGRGSGCCVSRAALGLVLILPPLREPVAAPAAAHKAVVEIAVGHLRDAAVREAPTGQLGHTAVPEAAAGHLRHPAVLTAAGTVAPCSAAAAAEKSALLAAAEHSAHAEAAGAGGIIHGDLRRAVAD